MQCGPDVPTADLPCALECTLGSPVINLSVDEVFYTSRMCLCTFALHSIVPRSLLMLLAGVFVSCSEARGYMMTTFWPLLWTNKLHSWVGEPFLHGSWHNPILIKTKGSRYPKFELSGLSKAYFAWFVGSVASTTFGHLDPPGKAWLLGPRRLT